MSQPHRCCCWIQRDTAWAVQVRVFYGGGGVLVECPGNARLKGRIDKHARGQEVRHIDFAVESSATPHGSIRQVLFPLMVASGAASPVASGRIDEHAPPGPRASPQVAVVRHIDVAAGIERDAEWIEQAGVFPADGAAGSFVERPSIASESADRQNTSAGTVPGRRL